jgi:hypothetical protein
MVLRDLGFVFAGSGQRGFFLIAGIEVDRYVHALPKGIEPMPMLGWKRIWRKKAD